MNCHVYRSSKKADTYLYLCDQSRNVKIAQGGENDPAFAKVPAPLMNMLGNLEWVMEVDLSTRTHLAQVDCATLIEHLNQSGYFLQLPPTQYQGA